MAQKLVHTAAGNGKDFPPEAYTYHDEVTPEVVRGMQEKVGIDFSAPEWKVIDALGQVVPA
jgi:hypothetical protein